MLYVENYVSIGRYVMCFAQKATYVICAQNELCYKIVYNEK